MIIHRQCIENTLVDRKSNNQFSNDLNDVIVVCFTRCMDNDKFIQSKYIFDLNMQMVLPL